MQAENISLRCCLILTSYKMPTASFPFHHPHNFTIQQNLSQISKHNSIQLKNLTSTKAEAKSQLLGKMERSAIFDNDLNLEATELRLGLPGRDESSSTSAIKSNKRSSSEMEINSSIENKSEQDNTPPPSKAQVVGWPPVRSYRKNALQQKKAESDASSVMFVKVSMDGAPYLRKIDLKGYKSYPELLKALENMFRCGTFGAYSETEGYDGSEFEPTYEDKDGDWMLVGDVPWDMFINSCKRLRITKGSEPKGLRCSL